MIEQTSIIVYTDNSELTSTQRNILTFLGNNPKSSFNDIISKFSHTDCRFIMKTIENLSDIGLVKVDGYQTTKYGDYVQTYSAMGGWRLFLDRINNDQNSNYLKKSRPRENQENTSQY